MSGTLPRGWTWATPDEIAANVPNALTIGPFGSDLKVPDYRAEGVPLVFVREIRAGRFGDARTKFVDEAKAAKLARHYVRPGDLLVTKMGDPPGDTAVYPSTRPPAIITADCIKLTPNTGLTIAEFLRDAFRAEPVRTQILDQTAGVAQQKLSLERFRTVRLPLPPLNEQRRIVAKLEALQARNRRAREALDTVPPLLEKLRQSILAAAFRGDLTKDWRAKNPNVEPASTLLERIRAERRKRWEGSELAKMKAKGKPPIDDKWKAKYNEPAPVDTTGLPELPEGWCWASVEELSTKVVDGVHKKPTYVAEGVPFLTVKNLTAGPGISFADVNHVTQADHEEYIKRTDPARGDILISKDGTLGVARLIKTDAVFSIFVSLALVKPVVRDMGEFLELAFWSPFFQERFKATGSGLLHIHLVDLRAAALPLAPVAEQEAVVARARDMLRVVERLDTTHVAASASLKTLVRSVLGKAFRGDLVPQDPSDEPAATTLRRQRVDEGETLGPSAYGGRTKRAARRARGKEAVEA